MGAKGKRQATKQTAKLSTAIVRDLPAKAARYAVFDKEVKGFCVRVSPSGGKSFALRYINPEGDVAWFTIGKLGSKGLTATTARVKAKLLQADALKGIDLIGVKKAARTASVLTLEAFIDEHYRSWILQNQRTGPEALQALAKNFKEFMPLRLDQITILRVEKWRDVQNVADSSINRRTSMLQGLLTKAKKWKFIEASPLAGLGKLTLDKEKKPRYLLEDEDERLYAALYARQAMQTSERTERNIWRARRHLPPLDPLLGTYTDFFLPLVTVALHTGLRRGELFNLKVSDIDLAQQKLTVRGREDAADKKPGKRRTKKLSKSGLSRDIPLSPTALKTLTVWLAENCTSELVFPHPETGERLACVGYIWKKVCKQAEITNLRFHDLRHTFASRLVMHGVDITTVSELMGHSSIETTQIYTHISDQHKTNAVAVLG